MSLSLQPTALTSVLSSLKESLLHLAFPHICEGCGTNVLNTDDFLCVKCFSELPVTSFHELEDNPVEKIFWGRIPIVSATAPYYFTKQSILQHLVHQLKYKRNKEVGLYLGRMLGKTLAQASRFADVEALIPLPLFPEKEHKRGYNQSALLCMGIAEVWQKPVLDRVVVRQHHTESQTKKNRLDRWENMEGKFELVDSSAISNKHILLVDDIVTTGATLESCALALLKAPQTRLSISTLCISSS